MSQSKVHPSTTGQGGKRGATKGDFPRSRGDGVYPRASKSRGVDAHTPLLATLVHPLHIREKKQKLTVDGGKGPCELIKRHIF